MKRVVLAVGLAASVAAPAAAQWTGMPVWNSPKGGTSYPKTTTVTAAVGLSVPLPTPGISIEPYFSPGLRYHKLENPVTGASASQTKFGFVLGANLGFGLFGLHAAYDYQDSDTG